MYPVTLLLTSFLSVTAALASSSHLSPRADSTAVSFSLIAARSTSPIHLRAINASDYGFYIGQSTSSYCPFQIQTCPPGNQTVITISNGSAIMDVEVPGGQQVYVSMTGALSYTPPHSTWIPPNSTTIGFEYTPPDSNFTLGAFSFHGDGANGFLACPFEAEGGPKGVWRVYADVKGVSDVGIRKRADCLPFAALTTKFRGTVAAWEYT
ncbi:MAG: hypothetical protein Q9190_007197 [Brigantiaea leucoxantha]